MRDKLLTVSLMTLFACAANAQQEAASGSNTNAFTPAETINQGGSFGLGPLLGEPTGLDLKYWISDKFALDGAAGWSFVEPDGFQLHGDLLFSPVDLFHGESSNLPFYFGVGGRVKFVENADNRAGIRGPFGVSWLLHKHRLEFFAEVAPVLDVSPKTTLEWNGGLGIRYYFR
jgi:hypothetical protein